MTYSRNFDAASYWSQNISLLDATYDDLAAQAVVLVSFG
jgi:hypothetical protein